MGTRAKFPIAGIGASAGGVEALQALFKGLPADSGMGFVIVSYMRRGQRSMLADILGRSTDMTVVEAGDGEKVAPDHVYICPPDHTLIMARGKLRLHDRPATGLHMPIDVFLDSLAEDRGEDTVGILLSGGGSDGTLGLKCIKEQGGLTLAQVADGGIAPRYTDMPDTAIAAGVVDLVVPVEEMSRRLVDHVRRYWPLGGSEEFRTCKSEEAESHRKAIHQTLMQQTGHDFSGYKQKTFGRRVHRRMQVLEMTSLEDYVDRLRNDADEVQRLFRDLLIGVTDFFRDPDALRNLVAAARRGLKGDLKSALREAVDSGQRVERARVAVDIDDRQQLINLVVEPFREDDSEPLLLVVFRDVGAPMTQAESIAPEAGGSDETVERLEHELADTRERLQITVEEYETSMEELKSANEELQSTNEELQSTNEELETAKEELQSLNEELHTVNARLARTVDEVKRATSDLRNTFDSTQIGTVFLDGNLVVRSFTPAATAIFNLIDSDCGRPLTDIAAHVEVGDLRRDIEAVAESGEPMERRVKRSDGAAHYLMRILPFRQESGAIEGVVVTFVDVTGLVEAEEHQQVLVAELNHRVRNMLTVVVALAKQTLAGDRSTRDVREAFIGRVHSMANAYTLISQENWHDVALRDIVQVELEPYWDDVGRITVEGRPVMCRPAAALALSLVVHELATNAAKYGALSDGDGSLAVKWTVETGDTLVLEWREASGRGTEPPGDKGLGSKLIERQIKSFPGASMELELAQEGLQARFAIPLGDLFVPAEGSEG